MHIKGFIKLKNRLGVAGMDPRRGEKVSESAGGPGPPAGGQGSERRRPGPVGSLRWF